MIKLTSSRVQAVVYKDIWKYEKELKLLKELELLVQAVTNRRSRPEV